MLISPDKKRYVSLETFQEAVRVLEVYTKIILFQFAKYSTGVRDNIIKNFIARSIVALKGILKLWEIEDYADCYVLNRCILDRLFHLRGLAKENAFEVFEKWSFEKQYEAKNKLWGDPELKDKLNPEFFKDLSGHKERYKKIKKEHISWFRPKAEDMAKDLDLDFLYKYGYDYSSTQVHPMANDGEADFLNLTKLDAGQPTVDQQSVLNNSCLAVTVLIQEALNDSNLLWKRIIYDFLEDFRSFLKDGSEKYKATFYKIGSLGPDMDFCKRVEKKEPIK